MASTLYISIPSRLAAQARSDWTTQALPFALMSAEGHVQQHGQKTLSELKSLAQGARQLSLLLSAGDISLLTTTVPPMSAGRFRAALPHLMEEQITCDPVDAVLVPTAVLNGEATVAVADRVWLETLAQLVKDWPVKKIAAYPAQLALAWPETSAAKVTAFIEHKDDTLELVLRSGLYSGMGLVLDQSDYAGALQMLSLLTSGSAIHLSVSVDVLETWQRVIKELQLTASINVSASGWPGRVAGLNEQTPDLMTGLSSMHKAAFDWAPWRWSVRLLALVVAVNLLALNLDWFSLKREAKGLSDSLTQTYRTSFPNETIILDPLAQMQQKMMLSQRLSGQLAPNDFVVLASQFAQVWDSVMAGKTSVNPGEIAAIEYKDRSLFVKLKSSAGIPMEALRAALSAQSLGMTASADGVLQIQVNTGGKR